MDIKISKTRLNQTIVYSKKGAYPAQCISYLYIYELEKYIELFPDDVFVDVGCAWGRLIGYLNLKYNVKKFVGIELNETVAVKAKHIYAKQEKVEIIEGDAVEHIPDDATVFYLFNPFDGEVLNAFLEQIQKVKWSTNKKLRLYYLHPIHANVFEKYPEWKLKKTSELKPKFMGAIYLNYYENDVIAETVRRRNSLLPVDSNIFSDSYLFPDYSHI